MPEPSCDTEAIVEYRLDRWVMDRLPWGAWAAILGLGIVLHAGSGGAGGAALALVYVAALAVAFIGWAATQVIDRSSPTIWLSLVVSLAIFLIAVATIGLLVGGTGRNPGVGGRLRWAMLVDPPIGVFGWMLIYLGSAWVAYGIVQHLKPPRPLLRLSPQGLTYHRFWLADVAIPWSAVRGVGPLEVPNAGGPLSVFPKAIAVSVEQDFYARQIAPKRSALAPPGAEAMFRPRGDLMQMVLSSPDLIVDPDALRRPMEARWTRYRMESPPVVPNEEPPLVYGRWAIGGSRLGLAWYLSPLVGLAAVLVSAFR